MKALDDITREAPMQPTATPVPTAPVAELGERVDYTRESYAWAGDVFFVYEHLGDTAKEVKTFSAARRALHKYAKANMDQFMGQLLPRAMQLYEKGRDKSGDADGILIEERKGIAELRRILVGAIEEAKGVTA